MRLLAILVGVVMFVVLLGGCNFRTTDEIQKEQQEVLLKEASSQTGMPNIKNFRERKLLKQILEMRDQDGLVTYTYLWNEFNGKLVFLGTTIGYGLPYATQYTNPQKPISNMSATSAIIAQADPNGLYSPESAEGTWILLKDPNSEDVKPVYVEPRILVSSFKLNVN